MKRQDVLAYLMVLNDSETLDEFSLRDFSVGAEDILGCLVRIQEQLELMQDIETLSLLKLREKLNGVISPSQEQLNELTILTKNLSNRLYSKYILRE